jgi:hypothetical protein
MGLLKLLIILHFHHHHPHKPRSPIAQLKLKTLSFSHIAIYDNKDFEHPVLVVEVGLSSKPPPELSESYIKSSEGNIRTVVAINLRYGAVKQHSIDIYRLELGATTYQIVLSATYVLRKYSKDGATFTNCDGAVKFYPADFGIGVGKEDPFTITFKEFLDVIDDAENSHKVAQPDRLLGKT